MIKLPRVLRFVGGTRNKVNKWKAAGYLSRTLKEGSPGVPTIVSRDAALEIAFMSVLTESGFSPKDSNAFANELLARQTSKSAPRYCLINPRNSLIYYAQRLEDIGPRIREITESVDEPTVGERNGVAAERPASSLVLINIGELTRRIKSLEDIA